MHSYDDVGVPVIRELVRRSYEAVLDGRQERRGPGSQDDGVVFETAGERRARQGVVLREMLMLWRIGLENLYELARELAANSPGRDALLLEFLELAPAWDDFAMVHAAEGLVMLAAADPYGDESLSVEIAHRLGARTVRFDDLGHSWMLEDPGLVAEAIQSFWASLP
jgi:pimeloyl-ACP methyl ester carboxylesterase